MTKNLATPHHLTILVTKAGRDVIPHLGVLFSLACARSRAHLVSPCTCTAACSVTAGLAETLPGFVCSRLRHWRCLVQTLAVCSVHRYISHAWSTLVNVKFMDKQHINQLLSTISPTDTKSSHHTVCSKTSDLGPFLSSAADFVFLFILLFSIAPSQSQHLDQRPSYCY